MALNKKRRAQDEPDTTTVSDMPADDVAADAAADEEVGGFAPLSDGSYLDESDPEKQKLVYEKVSAEDMKREMDRKRELRKQRREEREAKRSPVFSVARIGITAVTLLGAVGSLLYVAGTAGSYDEEYRANAEQINELSARQSGLEQDTRTQLQPNVVKHDLDLASERGQMIADVQNDMALTRSSLHMSDDERDKNLEVYATQVDRMRGMIAKESTSGGTFAPQQRWINPIEMAPQDGAENADAAQRPIARTRNVPADQYTWVVHTTRNIDTDKSIVPVIWTAHRTAGEDEGQLIAWTRALFDPNTGMFSAFDFGLTPYGQTLLKGTPSVEKQDKIQEQKTLKEVQAELERARGLEQQQNANAAQVDVSDVKQRQAKDAAKAQQQRDRGAEGVKETN